MDGSCSTRPERRRESSLVLRLHQPVNVDDEISHVRVVDRRLRLGAPGRQRFLVVGVHADDVELREILELDLVRGRQLAAEDKMQELSGSMIGHDVSYLAGSLMCATRSSSAACSAAFAPTTDG